MRLGPAPHTSNQTNGELAFGTSYRVLLAIEGRKVAEELHGKDDDAQAEPDTVDLSDYMFPAEVERVAKTYPLGVRATGRNPLGVRVAEVITDYAQFGSSRDSYTTVAEINQEEHTGDYAMLYEERSEATDHDDDTPMTEAEARTHFEAMGVEIINPDQITIH